MEEKEKEKKEVSEEERIGILIKPRSLLPEDRDSIRIIEKSLIKKTFMAFDFLKMGMSVRRGVDGWKSVVGFNLVEGEWGVYYKIDEKRFTNVYEDYIYPVYTFNGELKLNRSDVELLVIYRDYLFFLNERAKSVLKGLFGCDGLENGKVDVKRLCKVLKERWSDLSKYGDFKNCLLDVLAGFKATEILKRSVVLDFEHFWKFVKKFSIDSKKE